MNVKGCYECGSCGGDDDDDDDGCSPPCSGCSACINGSCIDQTTTKWTGDCCDSGTVECCPLTDTCECYPTKGDCECEPPKKVSSEGYVVMKIGLL